MPWDEDDEEFSRSYDAATGAWVFQCSLKDYNDTIAMFLEMVPYFMESVEFCEVLYETWAWSTSYELVDGEMMIEATDKFIQYAEVESY
jgi:hypothetical protein